MEYYWTIKSNEVLILTTARMNPGNMLSESVTKGHIVSDSVYTSRLEEANLLGQKADQWLQCWGMWQAMQDWGPEAQGFFEKR